MTSKYVPSRRICRHFGLSMIFAVIASICTTTNPLHAGEKKKQPRSVGECVSNEGVLLYNADKKWRAIRPGDALPANKSLVTMFDSTVLSANKAVKVRMIGGVGQHGNFSVFSTAVRFHPAGKGRDLVASIERGIVVFTNEKKKGPATVRLRTRDKKYLDLTLQEPGTRVGVDMFCRHSPGAGALEKDDPVRFAYFLTLKGQVLLASGDKSFRLQAPPGPAALKWDSLVQQPEVEYLKKMPKGAEADEKAEKAFALINQCASRLTKAFNKELKSLVDSKDAPCRRVAVTAMGAMNRLPLLFGVLSVSKNAEVRQQAIIVLREWLGRKPGQIAKMQKVLVDKVKVPPAAAKTFTHLLIGFDQEERSQPFLYELLIELLQHHRLAVRELAHWHLVRLAPQGMDIPYDAGGSEEQRKAGVEQWRKLIPSGQLPPEPGATAKSKEK